MDKKFELTKDQIAYIKEELKIETLKDVKIIIELDSEYAKSVKEQLTEDSNRFIKMGLCPPDYTYSLPTC